MAVERWKVSPRVLPDDPDIRRYVRQQAESDARGAVNGTSHVMESRGTHVAEQPQDMPAMLAEYGIVDLSTRPEPGPETFVVAGLVPENVSTTCYAGWGTFKSLLAIYMGFRICQGLDFLGHDVKQGSVLYLDAETNEDDLTRRVYQIAKGLGLARPPSGFLYHHVPVGGLEKTVTSLKDLYGKLTLRPVLTILDSWGGAGVDMLDAPGIVRVGGMMRELGTILTIDHLGHSALDHVIGSIYKENDPRSLLSLKAISRGARNVIQLIQKKRSNGNPSRDGFCFSVTFDGPNADPVHFERADEGGSAPASPAVKPDPPTLVALKTLLRPATAAELAQKLGIDSTAASKELSNLKRDGRVEKLGNKTWGLSSRELFSYGTEIFSGQLGRDRAEALTGFVDSILVRLPAVPTDHSDGSRPLLECMKAIAHLLQGAAE